MAQAKTAAGHVSSDACSINGIHHTVSVWQTKEAMRAYLVAGAHLEAMKIHNEISTGRVLGFGADATPPWSRVHELWDANGRIV